VKNKKIPNYRIAETNENEYGAWKKNALQHYGYFPVFQPFKEDFLLKNLSGNAVKLYIFLGLMSGNESGKTWVSIETMAKYFNKSKRAISQWLSELEKSHLIERMQMEQNGVAYTFLKPYGLGYAESKENSRKEQEES
jgi:DNA-binding transcriptional ArsR family regulator